MTEFQWVVIVSLGIILGLAIVGVFVVIRTHLTGSRMSRYSANNIIEVLLLVEELSRRTQHMVEAVGERVGADMPLGEAESIWNREDEQASISGGGHRLHGRRC